MSAAVTTPGRAVRGQVCGKHNVSYNQVLDPGVAGKRESVWIGACRECEKHLRDKLLAAEQVETQTEEITAEAERRIAADVGFEQRIRDSAAADLAEEVTQVVANHCAMRRPEWEEYHRDLEWNRVVAVVESERKSAIIFELQKKEKE